MGALCGSGAGLVIASKGTGHVPWQAVFVVLVAIGIVLDAIVGGILLALQRQRSRQGKWLRDDVTRDELVPVRWVLFSELVSCLRTNFFATR